MRIKFSGKLDEAFAVQSAARFVSRMIAPDPQCHPITSVGQTQFAVRFLFASEFQRCRCDLHVHARRYRPALRGPPTFTPRHSLHLDPKGVSLKILTASLYSAG